MQKPFKRAYTVITDKLYAGYYAGGSSKERTMHKLKKLYESGVRVLINLTERDEIRVDGETLFQIDECVKEFNLSVDSKLIHRRFPIKDMNIPSYEGMISILESIDTFMKQGVPIFLFCCGGFGRTGLGISVFLLRHNLATKENVFQVLQEYRKEDIAHYRPSPQRAIQKQFVLSYDWS